MYEVINHAYYYNSYMRLMQSYLLFVAQYSDFRIRLLLSFLFDSTSSMLLSNMYFEAAVCMRETKFRAFVILKRIERTV